METFSPLLPRYRRPFSVSGVLDDTIHVFRQAWLRFAGLNLLGTVISIVAVLIAVLAVALTVARPLLGLVRQGGLGATAATLGPAAGATAASLPPALLVGFGIAALFVGFVLALLAFASYAAAAIYTAGLMRGERPSIVRAYLAGLARTPALLGAAILFALVLTASTVLAFLPFAVIGRWYLLASLAALAGLAVWAFNAEARTAWLKWLIILGIPFGLPLYLVINWSLWPFTAAVERAGPVAALTRSGELAHGRWFRLLGMWSVMLILSAILQYIPGMLASAVFAGAGGTSTTTMEGVNLAAQLFNFAGNMVGGILFGSLPATAGTLALQALRNEREGADLVERLDLLRPSAPVAV